MASARRGRTCCGWSRRLSRPGRCFSASCAARARGEEMAESSQEWLDRLLDTFEIGEAAPVERTLAAWNAAADARGGHIVTYLEGDKRCVSSGGEAAYLLKPGRRRLDSEMRVSAAFALRPILPKKHNFIKSHKITPNTPS